MPCATHDETTPANWPFTVRASMEVITTNRVLDGAPVLLVSHDDDEQGGWQFLCGTTLRQEDGRVGCIGCFVEKDASFAELADLPLGWQARREGPTEPWKRVKKQTAVDQIRENAAREGFQILILPPQRPIWAMTYGLMKSVSQPDVVVIGLPPQIMHQMVLNLAGMAMEGEKLEHGLRTDRVLQTFECELRTVEPKWHDLLLGPLRELYDDAPPQMLQCTWPDKGGKLPHEEGFDMAFLQRQPRLELADPEVAGLAPLLRALRRP